MWKKKYANLGVSELPTGTVTLLLADVEGSTRLWEERTRRLRAQVDSANAWMLASCPVSALALHRTALREERWLHDRFGAGYEEYVARVPRYW